MTNDELRLELIKEIDWYFSNRKGVCLPISYLSMLKRAVHISASTDYHLAIGELQSIVEKLRDVRTHNVECE